jgi:PKD repeat protein
MLHRSGLQYIGANNTRLAGENIQINVAQGNFYEYIPESKLIEKNESIDIVYHDLKNNEFGFEIPEYDKQYTLYLDPIPIMEWGTYYGGIGNETGYGITTDQNENVYVTGESTSSSAIATSGAHQSSLKGNLNGFILKFNSFGQRLWGTYYGGIGFTECRNISIDQIGNIYVCGRTNSFSSIATLGAHQPSFGGDHDAFIVKFNSSGQRIWGTYYGGTNMEFCHDVETDQNGNVFIIGHTESPSAIATFGAHQETFNGVYDAFIVKFNSLGQRLWGTYYGGNTNEWGISIATDKNGNVFGTGHTQSSSNIATSGAHQPSFGGDYDAFIVKFSSSGQRIWGTYYGGTGDDFGFGVATDHNGSVYLTGKTNSITGIATLGSHQTSHGVGENVFIVKFNSLGKRIWGTYYCGNKNDFGRCVAIDHNGNVYLAGGTNSSSGFSTLDAYQKSFKGKTDAFVVKFNSSGQRIWGTYYGGSEHDYCNGIATGLNGNVYITGYTNSLFAIATSSAHQSSSGGSEEAFVAKFSACVSVFDTITITTTDSFYFNALMRYKSGIYYDTLVNYKGCDSFLTLFLFITSDPFTDFTINDSGQCLNSNTFQFINISMIDSSAIVEYNWYFGDGNTSTLRSPVHTYSSAGSHIVKLVVHVDTSYTDSVMKTVLVYPNPMTSFSINDSSQCLDSNSFVFTNLSVSDSGNLSFTWNFGDNSALINSTHALKVYKDWQKYTVSLIATNEHQCGDTFSKDVFVFPMPVAAFIVKNNCVEDTVWFFDESSVDTGDISQWYWDFKNGKTSTNQNPWMIFYDTGYKSVTMTSTTDFGCANRYHTLFCHQCKGYSTHHRKSYCDR